MNPDAQRITEVERENTLLKVFETEEVTKLRGLVVQLQEALVCVVDNLTYFEEAQFIEAQFTKTEVELIKAALAACTAGATEPKP